MVDAAPLAKRAPKIAAPDGLKRPKVSKDAANLVAGSAGSERARLIAAQAERAERINRTEAGMLVPADEIAAEWLGIVVTIRSGLLAVPARVAATHPGHPDIMATLERELLTAMAEIADDSL